MTQKKYINIERLKQNYIEAFNVGENIVLQEKVDGSNASFTYDKYSDEIAVFSRRQRLTNENNLQGFKQWIDANFTKNDIKDISNNGQYLFFGEWLKPHTVKYPKEAYDNFYMFDVWDTINEQYLTYNEMNNFFNRLKNISSNIKQVPVFYIGEFQSWEHVLSFRGKTELNAAPCGEGVVIKSQDRLQDNLNSRRPICLKLVDPRFSEVHSSHPKTIDPEKLKEETQNKDFVAQFVTQRRVEKILQKMIDEGELDINWGATDMKAIARFLPSAVFNDIKKEEPEAIKQLKNFGKYSGSLAMQHIRKILSDKEG